MQKIRIFALAKELGIDSKELIQHCQNAGIELKNSALASISPEEREKVVHYIQQQAEVDKGEEPQQPKEPVREQPADRKGKVRKIQSSRSKTERTSRRQPAPETAAESNVPPAHESPAREAAAESTSQPGGQEGQSSTSAGTAVAEETATETTSATEGEPDTETAVEEPSAETEEQQQAESPSTTESDQQEGGETEEEEGGKKVVPISRDDYVPAAGAMPSGIREMKPRGTVPESENRQGRASKGKSKTARPNVAAPPSYQKPQPKTSKKEETPAQKPDMKLTPEALEQQSPLAGHLRKHAEQKKEKKKKGAQEAPAEAKDAAKRGRKSPAERRQQERRNQRKVSRQTSDEEGRQGSGFRRRRQKRSSQTAPLKTSAQIEPPITVRSLSEALGRPAKLLMQILWKEGQMVSINQNIDEETALHLALELGVDLEIKRGRDIEEELAQALDTPDPAETLQPRPPVITLLGHVDHGKTTLMDRLRQTNVVDDEAGGITQHIASYQIEYEGQKLSFVDTPGHAAFGEMRARGANVTDIVVLVVAGNDGIMPQTVECISHAKAADVPIVVAMNKMDLPDINEQKILQDLAGHNILPAEWSGDTEVVRTSATTGQGIEELLETLLLTAELQELKANPDRPAIGVCLEGYRDPGRGVLAWLIVQKGTLRIGDNVLCGPAYGRIRAMYNDQNEEIDEAPPSTPVKVAGLDVIPGAGDHFFVLSDIEEAREVAENRREKGRAEQLAQRGGGRPRSFEDILEAARGGTAQDLPLILKADTPGSIEALRSEIEKFEHPEVQVEIVHEGVGGVNESDVYLASASGAIIVAFYVVPEDRAAALAEQEGVEIRRYNVIYEVTDDIKRTLEGLLAPERVEVATGRALVLQTFQISRYGRVAGCRILNGTIERNNRVRVIRDQKVLNTYRIASLKREKDDVKEVREGMECGIRVENFEDVKEGDILEGFRVEEVQRSLEEA